MRTLVFASRSLVVAAISVVVWSTLVEPNLLLVRRDHVAVADWRGPPLKVALVADLHVGCPSVDIERVATLAARLAIEEPDLVLLLGDYQVNAIPFGEHVPVGGWAASMAAVPAPLGVWAVLGNHDWWNDADATHEALQDVGIGVLDNAAVQLGTAPDAPWLVGVGDALTRHAAPEAALHGVPEGADVVAMAHSPEVARGLVGRADVLVAGHTHGGQVNLPWVTRRLLGPMADHGRLDVAGMPVWVSAGLGTSVLPIRFGRPPELVVLTVGRPAPG